MSPRRYVLGTLRLGGTLLYAETVGADKTSLDAVTALCCNETEAIGYYIGDEFLTPENFPGDKFGSVERGSKTDKFMITTDGDLDSPYTVTLSYSPVPGGMIDVFYAASGVDQRANVVSVVGHELILSGVSAQGPRTPITVRYESNSSVKLRLQFKSGIPDQTTESWPLVDTPRWTGAHRLRGVSHIRTLMVWDRTIYANGAPPIGAVVKGHQVDNHPFYDPRDGSNPSFTDNPAILAGWWMTLPRNRGGCGIPSDWIDWGSIAVAANICDELITARTLDGAGYEQIRRYRCNAVLSTENPPLDNLQIILSAMAGRRAFTAGKYRILAGAFRSATLTITDADIVGTKPINASSAGGDEAPANIVTASFAGAGKNWQESNPKPVRNDSYVDDDGHESPVDIRLQATTDPRLANYLMGVTLEALRPAFAVTLTVGGIGENIALYDTVQLNIGNRPAFVGKTFEVMQIADNWNGEFELVLNEIRPQTWALDPDKFTPIDPVVPPDLSYLWNVPPIADLAVELGEPQILPDGNAITQVTWSWDAPTALYIGDGGRIELRYAEASGEWIYVAPVPGDSTGTTTTASLVEGSNYVFQVRLVNSIGAASRSWTSFWIQVEGTELAVGVQGPGIFGWANPVGVSTTSSSITKTAGASAWDAGAHSLQSYTGGCFVSARCGQIGARRMIALNGDPAVDAGYLGLDFALHPNLSNVLQVYESGVLISSHGAYTAATTIAIKYDNSSVIYEKDGAVIRTTTVGAGRRFFLDVSLFEVGATLVDIAFGPMGGIGPQGLPGVAAQSVRLSATAYAFTYDGAGAASPAGQTVVFTATRQNIPTAAVWTTTPSGVTLTGSGDTRTLTIANFGANSSVKVRAETAGFFDEITIVRLSQGATGPGGISGILTNDNHTLAADPDGVVGSYAGASGLFLVYEGTVDRTSVATFSVASATNCAVQINTAANTPVAGQPRGFYRVTAVTADQASATLQAVYNGATTPKVFTLTRARQGQPGDGQNLLPIGDWVVGTLGNQGSPPRWLANDDTAGNGESRIVLGGAGTAPPGPFGTSEVLWECRSINGTGTNGDGGWNSPVVAVDHRRTYRSSVWFRVNQLSGSFYHGCNGGHTLNLDGSANGNPYFSGFNMAGGPFGMQANKWYLSVGVIHGSSYTGGYSGIAGIYDPETGRKVASGTEFRNALTATDQIHRCYHYYDSSTATRQWMPKPRLEEVNGNEPSVDALMGFQRSTPWIARGNCFAGTNTFAKIGGVSSWDDSDISSVQSFDNCHLQVKAGQTNAHFMVALNRDPLSDMSYASLDAAWYYTTGGLQIYENGIQIGEFGTYTTSTELGWTLEGGYIRYYKDRVLVRTIGPNPGQRYYVDSSFYTVGAMCSVKFGPGTEFESIGTADLAPDAATSTYEVSLPSLSLSSSGEILGINIPTQSTAHAVIVTATLQHYGTVSPGGFAGLGYDINGVGTGVSLSSTRNSQSSSPGTRSTLRGLVALTQPQAVSQARRYRLFWQTTSGDQVNLTNAVLQVEVIRR